MTDDKENRTEKLKNAFCNVREAFKRAWKALVSAVFRGKDPKDVSTGKKVGVALVGTLGVLLLVVTLVPAVLWGLTWKGADKIVEDVPPAVQAEEVPDIKEPA